MEILNKMKRQFESLQNKIGEDTVDQLTVLEFLDDVTRYISRKATWFIYRSTQFQNSNLNRVHIVNFVSIFSQFVIIQQR